MELIPAIGYEEFITETNQFDIVYSADSVVN
jgi:hypothetical protein